MMNEDMRRNMEFIVEQQARFAAHLDRLEEERIRDRPRQAELQKSFQTVVELLKIQESRLDREFDTVAIETRTTTLETNMVTLQTSMDALARSQKHADERLSALIDIVMQDRGRSS